MDSQVAASSGRRASRTRLRSISAAATCRESSRKGGAALDPAIACASVAIAWRQSGSLATGNVKPWHRAFCAARSLPAAVLGPVLFCALARLAASRAALIIDSPHTACCLFMICSNMHKKQNQAKYRCGDISGNVLVANGISAVAGAKSMASLRVRNLGNELIARLKRRAARHGRSTEAEHREILRQALVTEVEPSFESLAAELRRLTAERAQTPSEILLREGRDER
jgi:antitoxin FitA